MTKQKKLTIRYYSVDGNPHYKVQGLNQKQLKRIYPELKGRKLVLIRQETILVPA